MRTGALIASGAALALAGLAAPSAGGSASDLPAPAVRMAALHHGGVLRLARGALTQSSTNWAGYAVTHPQRFVSVTGKWVQPAATCDSATAQTYSAFWVGLGGFSASSYGVEQIGTLANCFFSTPSYSAWFELFPAPPVNLRLPVQPGDLLTATVAVKRHLVSLRLKDETTGRLFLRTVRLKRPDLGSAEWIAEAPTACDYTGNCTTLPLTNFGTVNFTHGYASVQGHRGRISDPVWSATTIELHGDLNDPSHPSQAGANAIPGLLGADGGSFSVSWQQLAPPPPGG
ncbi:MAG TPA: G1 family glutamic endopeptidase [Gaiellaceae bacterium]